MNVWTYSPETGELLPGNPRRAQVVWNRRHLPADDPKRYAVPANATMAEPPAAQEGYARCFVDGAWAQVEDHRGETVYDTKTGASRKIAEVGPLRRDVTVLKPGPHDKWDARQQAWAEDADSKAASDRETAIAEGREAARLRIATEDADKISAADIAIALGLREPAVA